jgi:Tfp pilus assembly protein PilF
MRDKLKKAVIAQLELALAHLEQDDIREATEAMENARAFLRKMEPQERGW